MLKHVSSFVVMEPTFWAIYCRRWIIARYIFDFSLLRIFASHRISNDLRHCDHTVLTCSSSFTWDMVSQTRLLNRLFGSPATCHPWCFPEVIMLQSSSPPADVVLQFLPSGTARKMSSAYSKFQRELFWWHVPWHPLQWWNTSKRELSMSALQHWS